MLSCFLTKNSLDALFGTNENLWIIETTRGEVGVESNDVLVDDINLLVVIKAAAVVN